MINNEIILYQGKWKENMPCMLKTDYIDTNTFQNFEFLSIFGEENDLIYDDQANIYFGNRNNFNKFHGKGVCKYKGGYIYFGEFRNNLWYGKGKLYNKNGIVYKGEFLKASFHKEGTIYFSEKSKYKGSFQKGEMHGKGELFYTDGRQYEGFFRKSVKHGRGVWKYTDKSTMEAVYNEGVIDGRAIHVSKNSNGKLVFMLRIYEKGKLISQKKCRKKPSLKNSCCRIF